MVRLGQGPQCFVEETRLRRNARVEKETPKPPPHSLVSVHGLSRRGKRRGRKERSTMHECEQRRRSYLEKGPYFLLGVGSRSKELPQPSAEQDGEHRPSMMELLFLHGATRKSLLSSPSCRPPCMCSAVLVFVPATSISALGFFKASLAFFRVPEVQMWRSVDLQRQLRAGRKEKLSIAREASLRRHVARGKATLATRRRGSGIRRLTPQTRFLFWRPAWLADAEQLGRWCSADPLI